MKYVLENVIKFILLIGVQVFVLNHISFSGYINPYLYILFILLLPFETPKWLLLLLGFFTGLIVDLFVHTPGMHAGACVFMAFLRPFAIDSISSKKEYEAGIRPVIQDLGFNWVLNYVGILTIAHHTLLFFLEVFHFQEFWITFGRIFFSAYFTILFIIITQYVFFKPRRNIVSGKI